jgi:multidrug resistance protein
MTVQAAKNSRPLAVVFFTVFLDLIGFGIIIPIQPFLAQQFGAGATVVTWLSASYSLMQFLFAPFWGRLSDRIGRRPVIIVSVATSCVGYTLFALSANLWMLFAARILAGFGNANIAAAQAVVADCTENEDRARGMGLIGVGFALGFIIGPALGAVAVPYGLSAPAFVSAALALINLVFAVGFLPETNAKKGQVRKQPGLLKAIPALLRLRYVPQILTVMLLLVWGFSLMEQSLPLFIQATFVSDAGAFGEAALLTSLVLFCVGVVSAIVQGGLIKQIVKRIGERGATIGGFLLLACGLMCFPLMHQTHAIVLLFLSGALLAAGFSMTNPSLQSLLSQKAPSQNQGLALGAGQSFCAMGRILGPAMAGVLFEYWAVLPFILALLLVLSCYSIVKWRVR